MDITKVKHNIEMYQENIAELARILNEANMKYQAAKQNLEHIRNEVDVFRSRADRVYYSSLCEEDFLQSLEKADRWFKNKLIKNLLENSSNLASNYPISDIDPEKFEKYKCELTGKFLMAPYEIQESISKLRKELKETYESVSRRIDVYFFPVHSNQIPYTIRYNSTGEFLNKLSFIEKKASAGNYYQVGVVLASTGSVWEHKETNYEGVIRIWETTDDTNKEMHALLSL